MCTVILWLVYCNCPSSGAPSTSDGDSDALVEKSVDAPPPHVALEAGEAGSSDAGGSESTDALELELVELEAEGAADHLL